MALALLLAVAAGAPSQAQAAGGSISGTVSEEGGPPLEGVCVGAYDFGTFDFFEAVTGPDGSYAIGDLPDATYFVAFYGCDSATHVSEIYDDAQDISEAEMLTISGGQALTGIDAQLALGGSISGLVTDDAEQPLAGVCVYAGGPGIAGGFTETGPDGSYTIGGLPPGEYTVEFSDCDSGVYLSEYYDDAVDQEDAEPVAVAGTAETSGIDASLARAGSITGTVQDDQGPVAGVCVTAESAAAGLARPGTTGEDGTYEVTGLPSDDYTVRFDSCGGDAFRTEYYDDAQDIGDAESVPVVVGQETGGIDATLAPRGSIAGTVRNAEGDPIEGICVYALENSNLIVAAAQTKPNGRYRLDGLDAGPYVVFFLGCDESADYGRQFFDGAALYEDATPVSVTTGTTTAGIDAELVLLGSISGTVSESGAGPLEDICVLATDGVVSGTARTEADGGYRIPGLRDGSYSVEFSDCERDRYVTEYYDDALQMGDADPIAVESEVDHSGIDAELAPTPTASIDDVAVTEGDTGETTDATFTVSLDTVPVQPVSIDFETADGSASAPADYASNQGTLDFAIGEQSKQLTVVVNGDTIHEPEETFEVDLTDAGNATIGDGTGLGTISDNDPPGVSIGDAQVTEGNSGNRSAVFTVALDQPSTEPTSVDLSTADGSAEAPGDYQARSETVTFAPGQTSKQRTIKVAGDTIDEPDETFEVDLIDAGNVTIGDGTGVGTIIDDDLAALSIDDVQLVEGSAGTSSAVFTIALDRPTTKPVSVELNTADGTAKAPGDYAAKLDTITFAPGETSKQRAIEVVGDTLDELDERFRVKLSGASKATIADPVGIGTIVDDDDATLSIDDVTVAEGNHGKRSAVFTIGLGQTAAQPIQVDYTTVDASATEPDDYEARSGTVNLSPGQSSKQVTIKVNGDRLFEGEEEFEVRLSGPQNASIADGVGEGTIADDDGDQEFNGTIAGRVTDDGDVPLSRICVLAFSLEANADFTARTASDGTYKIRGLPGGNYIIVFWDCATGAYVDEFYDDAHHVEDLELLPMLGGRHLTGIDARLAVGGSISGRVADEGGEPLRGICVSASGGGDAGFYGDSRTRANGRYSIRGLLSGDYEVAFFDCNGPSYAPQYYDRADHPGDADPVPVVAPDESAGVDAVLAVGGSITGRVTDDLNDPIDSVCVYATNLDHPDAFGTYFALTDLDGRYEISGLAAGDYAVSFYPCGGSVHVPEYYDDVLDIDPGKAKPVPVALGSTTNHVDASLATSSIAGTVTDEDGEPLQGVCVSAHKADGPGGFVTAETGADGSYRIDAPADVYTVRFFDCKGGDLVAEYFDDSLTESGATDIATFEGRVSIDIDAELALGGSISGTVTDADGAPIEGVCVNVFGADNTHIVGFAQTDADGNYRAAGLPPIDHKAYFDDCVGAGFVNEFYDDSRDSDGAERIPVAVGEDTPGIDAVLAVDGSISGRVTAPGGAPIGGICVSAEGIGTPGADSAVTTANGRYTLSGLATDDYVVRFSDCETGEYLEEFYDDADDAGAAEPVPVVAPEPTAHVDAELARSGSISGTVTGEGGPGGALADVCVRAYDDDGGVVSSTRTGADGRFQLFSLGTGLYRVGYSPCGADRYAAEFFDDKRRLADAEGISVTVGADSPGADAALRFVPRISIDDTTIEEGDSAGTSAPFTITLSEPTTVPVSVDLSTADGTAKAPGDYQAKFDTVTFAPGETSKQSAIEIVGDAVEEPDERFKVKLSGASKATIADSVGIGTIIDDDFPALSIDDVEVQEGNGGNRSAVFTIALDRPSTKPVSVELGTADRTAEAPGDYEAKLDTVTFAPGQTSKQRTVKVVGDTIEELDEAFEVALSNASKATIADSVGIGTILDDD